MNVKNSKDNLITEKEIKSILKTNLINNPIKSLKLNLRTFNINKNNENSLNKYIINERNKITVFSNCQETNYYNYPNNEFPKIKLKNKAKILSFRNKRKKTNLLYKLNYNNDEIYNNLKKYTNNSSTYQKFRNLNNSHHRYSVNKADKSILLQTIKEKNIDIYNFPNIKKNPRSFLKFPPIKFKTIADLNYNNDSELYDHFDNKIFENEELIKKIKISLIQDINTEEKNLKLYLDYLKPKTHYYNYFEDVYMIPHIRNNFGLSKGFDTFEDLNNKLCNHNFLNKTVVLSMNRTRIMRDLIIKQEEGERQKILEEIKKAPILKLKYFGEDIISQYENKFEKYELQDSFEKCMNNQIISFADKKLKKLIFSKKFYEK